MEPDRIWLTVETQVQTAFILIGIILFFMLSRSDKAEYLELGVILVLAAASDIISAVGFHITRTNMNLTSSIYSILVLPVAISLYKKRIHWKNINAIATTIVVVYVAFALINLFAIQGLFSYNSYTNSFRAVCFIAMSLTYFYVLILQLPTESITKLPMFWINTGILIYYSGTFFMNLGASYLVNVLNDNLITYWMIYYLFGLVYYSILWYALLLIRSEHGRS